MEAPVEGVATRLWAHLKQEQAAGRKRYALDIVIYASTLVAKKLDARWCSFRTGLKLSWRWLPAGRLSEAT